MSVFSFPGPQSLLPDPGSGRRTPLPEVTPTRSPSRPGVGRGTQTRTIL